MEGFSGRVGSDPRGSAVMVLPSTPETKGKGPSFLGNCGLMVAENLEVISSSHFQSPQSYIPPSCGFTYSFLSPSIPILNNDAYEGQTSVDIPTLEMEAIQPAFPYQMFESVNPLSSNPRSPIKDSSMVAVNQRVTTGSHSGGRADAPQDCETSWIWFEIRVNVVMIQETEKAECDRRFMGSVWTARNKDWAALPASEASGGILIIWTLKNCVGRRLTPSMKDFDDFIRDCDFIDSPLRSAPFTWSNLQEHPVCKRLDRFLYSNEWEQVFPQSLQEVLPRWTSDHWPIVLETNPFKWAPTPFRFENMWLQHPSFKESFEVGGESFKEMGGKGTSS
ncbi:hypothetical protein CK203_071806 [Vitis vinifera]|uniref:Endonuclease/exonuclease/phosphatase domain-containing protein n=1 Tax=Vitis vinifera TaxID=29760 RepID=A0A438C353_VITVI|nr:hypothetical protein CK203_071806 [Vitis vinifera]